VEVQSLSNQQCAQLPVPYPDVEVTTLGDVVGSFVQWPLKSILVVEKVDKPHTFVAVKTAVSYDKKYDALEYKNKITSSWLKQVNDLAVSISSKTCDSVVVRLEHDICGTIDDMAVFGAKELFEFVDVDVLEVVHVKLWMK